MDVLYAINTKKESAVLNAPRSTVKLLSDTDSTISIAQLLEFVNRYFPDILPESVLRHYGYDARPEGDLGENVLYSDRRADVSEIQDELERLNIETKDVISLADGYFKNYGGAMNRSEIRYAFLRAIKIMSETTADSYEQAFEEIVRIADELEKSFLS